jgi:RNA polymerase sigma-70 factor (ECF subfamily)
MLGSVFDADDALQETLLRAWQGIGAFESRSSLRGWLHTIATNTCLTHLERAKRRALPMDLGPAAEPAQPPGAPLVESVWIEPYPDERYGLTDGRAAPEARYDEREAVELAFVAALQHVPPNQRAALMLCEVLGFSSQEAAQMLDTSTASINSALQRARAAVAERVPQRTQQATLRALGDDGLRRLVARYVDAWERNDVAAFTALLTDDATFAMPPLSTWYDTREGIATWAGLSPMSGEWRWRTRLVRANGQPALAFYSWDEDTGAYLPFALNVLTLAGELVSSVTAFIARSIDAPDPEAFQRYPDEPFDERLLAGTFGRFGLPERLEE